jgi:aryl-alcohol dehydrogenase-like predicted oxidoreductase
MIYRMLGPTGTKVSPLCLGTMNFGNDGWGCDEATSLSILDRYLEAGGNFIDTANVYAGGRSEEILGRGLRNRRDQVILATKGYFPMGPGVNATGNSRLNLRRQVEASLRRLDTDWIDLYQIHIWDALTPIEETLGVLSDLVHEGKIHYLGCCNLTAWQMTVAQERAEQAGLEKFVTVQPQYSLICRDIEMEVMAAADLYDMGILAWSPLAFGMLAGKYDREARRGPDRARLTDVHPDDVMAKWKEQEAAALATTPVALSLRWVLEQPSVTAAIIGPRSVEQLEGNLAALDLDAPESVLDRLDEVSEPFESYLDFMQNAYFAQRMLDLA